MSAASDAAYAALRRHQPEDCSGVSPTRCAGCAADCTYCEGQHDWPCDAVIVASALLAHLGLRMVRDES